MRITRKTLAAVAVAAVLSTAVVAVPGSPFAAPTASAQQQCGSVAQVLDIIATEFISPFAGGPVGELIVAVAGTEANESPAGALKRCFDEARGRGDDSAEEPSEPLPGGAITRAEAEEAERSESILAWIFGDPHLVTHDGLRYDFQGIGDFVLLENEEAGVEVHVRLDRVLDRPATVTRGVAARVGASVLTFNDQPGGPSEAVPTVAVDGEVVEFLNGGWYEGDRFRIFRRGEVMTLEVDGAFGMVIDDSSATTIVPPTWAGEVRGLLGDGDGDPSNDVALRDGTPIAPFEADALYGPFLADWEVTGEASLFASPFEAAEIGGQPTEVVALADLDAAAVADAIAVCEEAGLAPGADFEACVFDVAITGDPGWAAAPAEPSGPSISAAAIAPRVTRELDVDAGTHTGRIESRGAAHDYRLGAAPGGESRVLQPAEPCDGSLPAAVAVITAGRIEREVALRCGVSAELPAGATTLRVFSPALGTPDYGFAVLRRSVTGDVDAGDLPLGSTITIEATADDQVWRWSVPDGIDELFVASVDVRAVDASTSACGARWSLVDGSADTTAGGSLCFDAPRVAVADAEVFEAAIPAGVEASFGVGAVGAGETGTADGGAAPWRGVLDSPGQVDRLEIEVDAGQELLLSDPDGANPCEARWSIDIGDQRLFEGASCFDTDPVVVPEAGAAVVAIDAGTATGPYAIVVTRVPEPREAPLTFGAALDASIEVPGQRVRFPFSAGAGDRIILEDPSDQNPCDIVWRLIDAAGEVGFEGASCLDTDAVELATGDWVLEVDGKAATAGAVAVTAWLAPPPRVGELGFGEEIGAGLAAPGSQWLLSFSAPPGSELVLETRPGNDCGIIWRVLDGTSEVVSEAPTCFDADPIALEAGGEYTLQIIGRQAAFGPTNFVATLD